MEENHAFAIEVARDTRQPGRYRWSVSEDTKVRDTSFYSFATKARSPRRRRPVRRNAQGHLATAI